MLWRPSHFTATELFSYYHTFLFNRHNHHTLLSPTTLTFNFVLCQSANNLTIHTQKNDIIKSFNGAFVPSHSWHENISPGGRWARELPFRDLFSSQKGKHSQAHAETHLTTLQAFRSVWNKPVSTSSVRDTCRATAKLHHWKQEAIVSTSTE